VFYLLFDVETDESSWFSEDILPITDENCYIHDSDKAIELISELIKSGKIDKTHTKIKKNIMRLFSLYSEENINNELDYYKKFMTLYDRLSERQKLKKIADKTVIGVGGKFSAGKSKFINAIAGLDGLLPESTSPTTSIPTYIIRDTSNSYTSNNKFGRSYNLSKEQLQAMTHEFFDTYNIGFSSFIESIIIGNEFWKLDNNIVLLDTPGYNKYDNKVAESISDKMKAHDQLKITDFLIWLADIDNGTITQDDIVFMEELNIPMPILIVFNKCERKTPSQIKSVLEQTVNSIENTNLKCYGIAAYSALEQKEYDGRVIMAEERVYRGHLISDFLQFTAKSNIHNNDILAQFEKLESLFKYEIDMFNKEISETNNNLENFIQKSENIMDIKSVSLVWSFVRKKKHDMYIKSIEADRIIKNINQLTENYLGGESYDK